MGDLTVSLHGEVVGRISDRGAAFDFLPSADAVRGHGLGSRVLSVAVPLVPRPTLAGRSVRQNFFAELLPEGDARRRLAQEAGIRDPGDVVAMLRVYGRDVAGAIQVWDPELPDEPRTPALEPLDDAGIAAMLRDVGAMPLGNKPRRGKTSLGGVQDKIVLVRTGTGWARALDGYPSTHILKPKVTRYPSMIFDEEYGSRFVRALELAVFETEILSFAGEPALVITRYDRSPEAVDGRVHQEDFNQVLGRRGDEKYEIYGKRGLKDVAAFLSSEDRVRLLRMVTLSVVLGNLDMHLKNISLLHDAEGGFELAPMYDVVPQHFPEYRNDGEIALSIGSTFEYTRLDRALIAAEGASWGVTDSAAIVDGTLAQILVTARHEIPHPAAHAGLQHSVIQVAENLIAGNMVAGLKPDVHSAEVRGAGGPGGWTWDNARPPRS